ncbi:MAG: hypothetical protein HYV04_16165 [Deltaproteobacteria bacterium]|nr:hypothetical protein [Deltaproteobacteria bacterium]
MKLKLTRHILAAILLLSLTFVPQLSPRAEEAWNFLDGFTPIPGRITRVGERYVAALFVNSEKQLLALVVFNATCDSGSCRVNRRAAYSVVDAAGSNIRSHVEPGEEELINLIADRVTV